MSDSQLLHHLRLASPFDHFADQPRAMPVSTNEFQNRIGLLCGDDYGHTDAHVENLVKLLFWDAAFVLNDLKQRRHLPRMLVDAHVAMRGEHPWNVVHET